MAHTIRIAIAGLATVLFAVACSPGPGPSGTELIQTASRGAKNALAGEPERTTTTTAAVASPAARFRGERIPIAGGPNLGWTDESVADLYYRLRTIGQSEDGAACHTIVIAWHVSHDELSNLDSIPPTIMQDIAEHKARLCD